MSCSLFLKISYNRDFEVIDFCGEGHWDEMCLQCDNGLLSPEPFAADWAVLVTLFTGESDSKWNYFHRKQNT